MPLMLMRDQFMVKDPSRVISATQAWKTYMDGVTPPVRLPISMLYQHRKRGPGGLTRGVYRPYPWAADSLLSAMKIAQYGTLSSNIDGYQPPYPEVMMTKARESALRDGRKMPPGPGIPSQKPPLMRALQQKRPIVPPPAAFAPEGVPASELPDPRVHARPRTWIDYRIALHQRETAAQNTLKMVLGPDARRVPRTVIPT